MNTTGINEWLRQVYNEFDRYSQQTGTEYSIECDEPNIQSYRVIKAPDIVGFVHHIVNHARDYPISIEINDKPIRAGDITTSDFNIPSRKGGTLLKFMVQPIQETDMVDEDKPDLDAEEVSEDQMKFPTNRHSRAQSVWRSGNRRLKGAYKYESFDRRLDDTLNETIGISLTPPDILLTKSDITPVRVDPTSILQEARCSIEQALHNLSILLEQADDNTQDAIEELIENCTAQISQIDALMNGRTDANQTDDMS